MVYPFLAGVLFGVFFANSLFKIVFKWLSHSGRSVYGLDHAKLNLELPPQNMWMNMGYWTDPVRARLAILSRPLSGPFRFTV